MLGLKTSTEEIFKLTHVASVTALLFIYKTDNWLNEHVRDFLNNLCTFLSVICLWVFLIHAPASVQRGSTKVLECWRLYHNLITDFSACDQ